MRIKIIFKLDWLNKGSRMEEIAQMNLNKYHILDSIIKMNFFSSQLTIQNSYFLIDFLEG